MDQVGTIRWPLSLHEDASDHYYTHDGIQMALYDAYSSVFDILTGQQEHPIMDLYSTHMADYRAKYKTAKSHHRPTDHDMIEAGLEFSSSFLVPVLAGDASLAEEFISSLKFHIG